MGVRTRATLPGLLCLAAFALPALLSGSAGEEAREVVERFTGPESGDEYVVLLDPESGAKWIEAPGGRRFASAGEVASAELREVGEPHCRIDPELRPAVRDPRSDARVPVILLLRDQPLHDASEELREGLERDLDEITAPAREILADREPDERTEAERRTVRHSIDAARGRLRVFRRDVFDRAARRCEVLQAPILDALPDARVTGATVLLNAVWIEAAPVELPGLLDEFPEIWRVLPVRTLRTLLDRSVPSAGASSFWTGGYTGSGAYVAVLDTGMDNQHPALKSGIAHEKVFLDNGKSYTYFQDDATSTDDVHGHGSHCGGIVGSRDITYTGVARGVNLVNAKWMFLWKVGSLRGGLGYDGDLFDAVEWAKDNSDVLSCSFGGSTSNNDGSSADALLMDAVVHDLKIHVAVAAGNSGAGGSGSVLTPGDTFNVITVGNYYDSGTTSASDDSMSSSSSLGPTKDGRRKPELSAPGTYIKSASAQWEGGNADFVNGSGTSMAAPHVAGGLGLLVDYRSSYTPQALKALLVNSARNTSPFPTTPDDKWGFGGMDLVAAYAARGDVVEGTLTSSGTELVYLTRSASLASGDRATLVWNRHVAYSSSAWPGTPPSLLDLDLHLHDGSTGAEDTKSVSAVNPVEQVKATGTVASPVIRIHRSDDFPSAFGTESWALAAPAGFVVVDPPELTLSAASPDSPVGPGEVFDFSVTVSNTGGLAAIAPEVTLALPTGYSLASGKNPVALANVAAGGSATAEFSVKAPSTTRLATLAASAESDSFGERLVGGPSSRTQQVDATPPTGSVTIDGGEPYTSDVEVTLTLSASDAHAGVSRMRFSDDGSTWSAWEGYRTSRTWTLGGGEGTQTVHAVFEDGVGNLSSPVSDSVYLDTVPPVGSASLHGGSPYTASSDVTLALSATDGGSGVADMRLRDAGETWGSWIAYVARETWRLPAGEGARTVEVQFRDAAGNVSTARSVEIVVDWTPPTGSVAIEDGAPYTPESTVALDLYPSDDPTGIAKVRLSADGTTWGDWLPYAPRVEFRLAGDDGEKAIHVLFSDGAGNVSTSAATDTIVLDREGPAGTVTLDSTHTNRSTVTLTLSAGDDLSGVPDMRLRNEGGPFGEWMAYSATTSWPLSAGEGTKTVHVQFRDGAGNLSTEAAATITLDQTPPGTGSVEIEGGWPATNRAEVELAIDGSDDRSEVVLMRLGPDGSTWGDWVPFSGSATFTLPAGEGERSVFLQLEDEAGNASEAFHDRILVDLTAPEAVFTVNDRASYVLAKEGLVLRFDDSSEADGSGVRDFRVSFDDGASWSGSRSLRDGLSVAVERPGHDGLLETLAIVRDMAGNESPAAGVPVYLVEADLARMVSGTRLRGALSSPHDVDAVAVHVVAGDALTVRVRRRKDLDIAVDLIGPWSGRILRGRYPPDARKPGFRRFEVSTTGRYLVVVRRKGGSEAETGTYLLRVFVRRGPGSRSFRGEADDGRISFDAVEGSILSGRLAAERLSSGDVALVGPGGPVELSLRERGERVVILPTVLAAGTGTYELVANTWRTVGYRLETKPPRRPRGTLEE